MYDPKIKTVGLTPKLDSSLNFSSFPKSLSSNFGALSPTLNGDLPALCVSTEKTAAQIRLVNISANTNIRLRSSLTQV